MVLGPAELFEATQRVDARITLLGSAPALKNRARVHFHQGTAEAIAEVTLLKGSSELAAGDSAFAQLRLDIPLLLLPGDRFILRRFSPVVTIGGGAVVDARAPRHRRKDTAVIQFLWCSRTRQTGRNSRRAGRSNATRNDVRGNSSAHGMDRRGRTRDGRKIGGWETLADLLARADRGGAGKIRDGFCCSDWQGCRDFSFRESPAARNPETGVARASGARARGVVRSGARRSGAGEGARGGWRSGTRSRARNQRFPPRKRDAKELIEREFESAGLTVPGFASVLAKLPVDAARAQKILQILLREKVLVKIAADLMFHQYSADEAAGIAREIPQRARRAPADHCIQGTYGVTRKYAIPLLEHLDREQVTRRVGDERVIL